MEEKATNEVSANVTEDIYMEESTITTDINMEESTSTTGEVDEKKRKTWGGFTCCVPKCYNNSVRDKHLKFYVIPKDEHLRQKWLQKISRKGFTPNRHRVCSAHFETIQLIKGKERTSRNSLGRIPYLWL